MGLRRWPSAWDLVEEVQAGRPRLLKLAGGMKGGAKESDQSTVRVEGWARGSPDVRGSKSAGESVEAARAEGVCPVSPIDVAAPGRDRAGEAGSPLPGWPPVPREPCAAGQCIR